MKSTLLLLFISYSSLFSFAQIDVQKDSIALLFDYKRSVILNNSVLELKFREINEPISKIVLIGYTDSLGEVSDNELLAEKRIQAVNTLLKNSAWKNVLIETKNVNETGGFPQTSLELNRRVDVLVFVSAKQEKPLVFELNKPVNLNINFENANAVVKAESIPNLEKLNRILLEDTSLFVRLNGHVCCTSAQELSFQRANTVMTYLLKHGIPQSRIYAEGFSNTQLLVPDNSEENMAINRRVEAIFYRKD